MEHAEMESRRPCGAAQRPGRPLRVLAAAGLCMLAIPAGAGEQTLGFRLVTRPIDVKTEKFAAVEGVTISAGRYAGTAVFEDGRLANKEFTFSYDFRRGAGPFYGYSSYTFVDGSALVMRYEGVLEPGKPMLGRYTVLSGSGKYAGATGDGYFEKVDDPWEGANLFQGRLRVVTP